MDNTLLQEAKNEYVREVWKNDTLDWEHILKTTAEENNTPLFLFKNLDDHFNKIATRYAAKENEQLREDVKNLRSAALNYLDCQFNAEDRSVAEIVNAGTELRTLLSKTAHYDNQNTDV